MNDLQTYVKKLIYKSNHRGSKEMDILLGKFASKYIDLFNEEELKLFEMILELDDRDIYQYALGKSEIPEKLQNRVMTLLKDSTSRMTSAALNKDSDRNPIILESGTITNYNQLINQLTENGYVRVSTINELGEFSVKGDIIDIFPNGYKDPIRINLYGNEIEKIEDFELKDGSKINKINRVIINPFSEFTFNQNKRKIKADTFLTDLSTFEVDDLIVHVDHGIGKFLGLKNVTVLDTDHDCVEIEYFNSDKLFIPVENIELLSKYGTKNEFVELDKLGSSHWQYRKASAKNKINEIAGVLIKTAAERSVNKAPLFRTQEPHYSNFLREFDHVDTEDQINATSEILNDINSGMPMDRLICGDVGYGKTEVALRAAFNVAMNDFQVAFIVPTTLLSNQHYNNFVERFKNFPIKICQLSRLVNKSEAEKNIEMINSGEANIVVGTHALLSKKINFKELGLLIIDEEQHFGVSQKEKIKSFRSDVHVLSLTATPIPRTLQMSLVGLRDLSIISTAPLNRQPINTEIVEFKNVNIIEAIKNEINRDGQVYYVCPRISDLKDIENFLEEKLPGVKFKIAHGQMTPKDLKRTMVEFYNNEFQILLCTTIVESGLDLRKTNTMIVHNADRFGLSQLYQLRGRIGRSDIEAYCYYSVHDINGITENSLKRLKILKKFSTRGSSFNLASHDLDMRGSGNIIGGEQSGHVKEVGLELYHRLLKDKINELRTDNKNIDNEWSPQLNLGLSVLIPESYIPNLNTRLYFYRKLAYLQSVEDLKLAKLEMFERFGELPKEVSHLIEITELRVLCKLLSIEKFDLGNRGLIIKFRDNKFDKIDQLIDFIQKGQYNIKLRTDQTLVYNFNIKNKNERIEKAFNFVKKLSNL